MTKAVKANFTICPSLKHSKSPLAADDASNAVNDGQLALCVEGDVRKKTKFVWKTMHVEKAITFGVVKPENSLAKLAKYHLGKYLWRTYYDSKVSCKLTKLAIKKTAIIKECHQILNALSKIEQLLRQTVQMPRSLNDAFNEYGQLLQLDDEHSGGEVKKIRSAFRDVCGPAFRNFRASKDADVALFVRKQVLGILHMAQYWNKALSLKESRFSTSGAFGCYIENGINAVKRYQFPVGIKPYTVVTDAVQYENYALTDDGSSRIQSLKTIEIDCSVSKAYRVFEVEHRLSNFDVARFEANLLPKPEDSLRTSGCGMFDVSMQWKRLRGVKDLSDKREGVIQKIPYVLVNGFLSLIYQAFDFALSFFLNTSYYVPSRHLKWQWRSDKKDLSRVYNATELAKISEPNTWADLYNEVKKINPAKSLGTRLGLGLRFIVDFFVLEPVLAVLAALGQGLTHIYADVTLFFSKLKRQDLAVKNRNIWDSALTLEAIARRKGVFSAEYIAQKKHAYRPANNPIASVLYNITGYIAALIRLPFTLLACLPCFVGLRKFNSAGLQLKSNLMQFAVLGAETWKGISTAVNFVGAALMGLVAQRIPRFLGWLFINQIMARIAPKFTLSKALRCSIKMDNAAEKTASVFRSCTGLKAARGVLAVCP